MKISPQLERDAREAERLYGRIMYADPPGPDPKKHPRMSMEQRAAQFLPFSALKGYDDAVEEKARVTDSRPELDEDQKQILDEKLNEILYLMREGDKDHGINAVISHFVPDVRKEGGNIHTVAGEIKKIDIRNDLIVLQDGTRIAISGIVDIDLAGHRSFELPEPFGI
ncbi:MAG: hypothetical protein IJ930_00525 [Lachnospiraceae bacterium]|nr:hypothetical protein [Lachnospiraceae bacterium]